MVCTRIAVAAAGLALISGAAAGSVASAQLAPPAGRLFGSIQVDGGNAADGTTVIAHVNGSSCGQGTYDASQGIYYVDLDSSNSDCGTAGNTVWFSVGSCTAYNTGTVPDFSGAEEVDLIAPGTC